MCPWYARRRDGHGRSDSREHDPRPRPRLRAARRRDGRRPLGRRTPPGSPSPAGRSELDESDEGLIRFLMRDRHGTPFEHNAFRFHVRCPIFVAREWFRHRIGSFNEFSMRYAKATDDFYVPAAGGRPLAGRQAGRVHVRAGRPRARRADARASCRPSTRRPTRRTRGSSSRASRARWPARCCPVGAYTEFYWTVNARALMNFVSLRAAETAQREIRRYAEAVERFFAERDAGHARRLRRERPRRALIRIDRFGHARRFGYPRPTRNLVHVLRSGVGGAAGRLVGAPGRWATTTQSFHSVSECGALSCTWVTSAWTRKVPQLGPSSSPVREVELVVAAARERLQAADAEHDRPVAGAVGGAEPGSTRTGPARAPCIGIGAPTASKPAPRWPTGSRRRTRRRRARPPARARRRAAGAAGRSLRAARGRALPRARAAAPAAGPPATSRSCTRRSRASSSGARSSPTRSRKSGGRSLTALSPSRISASRASAARVRVFTVPSGMPRNSATSLWERPLQ